MFVAPPGHGRARFGCETKIIYELLYNPEESIVPAGSVENRISRGRIGGYLSMKVFSNELAGPTKSACIA